MTGMSIGIYLIIALLFLIYIIWTWNSTKKLDSPIRQIIYLLFGTAIVAIVTLIIFQFSKIGLEYAQKEMIGEVRKIILLVFVPINGFCTLPQIAKILNSPNKQENSEKNYEKTIKRTLIIFIILVILELIYFRRIQGTIIQIVNSRM